MDAQVREAMLAGDLKVLDALLADDLVFRSNREPADKGGRLGRTPPRPT
jgi:ketosteroid isomerase-like protein